MSWYLFTTTGRIHCQYVQRWV